jgi:hypothetical protein
MRLNAFLREAAGDASRTTALQEALHCVGFGIAQITKKKSITADNMEDAELFSDSFNTFCEVDVDVQSLFDFGMENESWTKSVVTAVNAVKVSGWLKGNKYDIYRGKGQMNQIYDQYNKLRKMEGIKLANDKWNPSDIWMSKLSNIPNFEKLMELNKFISDKLKVGSLVGISLKKVGKSAKVVWQGPTDKPEIVGFKVVKKPAEIFPTGMVITTTKGGIFINFRSFRISKQADITGEIIQKGGAARHGKVPQSVKREAIDKYKIPQMPKNKIKQMVDGERTDELIKMAVDLWKQSGYKFSEKDIMKGWELRKKKGIQNDVGYWQSILHALEMGAFLSTHKGVAQDIVNDFYVGATSTSGVSSEFIKVY